MTPPGEEAIAAMSETELTETLARLRSPIEQLDPVDRAAAELDAAATPIEKAAKAYRKHRGLDRPGRATKEQAADALRGYAAGPRN